MVISEIPEEGLELAFTKTIESDAFIKILSPVNASLRVDKKGTEVIIKGIANAFVEQQCSRCLKVFSMDVKSVIDITYRPTADINKDEHYELKSDELDTDFYKNDILDINDLLKEQLLLNVPMKPLCSTECKGLCPKCGADLNETKCNCVISEIDSRLSVLKQLLSTERSK